MRYRLWEGKATGTSFSVVQEPTDMGKHLEELSAPGHGELDARFDALEGAVQILLLQDLDEALLVLGILN